MCELCRKNIGESARSDEVTRITHEILAKIKPLKLVLFGSYARGDVHQGSDADFLVVAEFSESFFDRIGRIQELSRGRMAVDAFPYTPEEFEKLVRKKNPLVMRALKEGVSIA